MSVTFARAEEASRLVAFALLGTLVSCSGELPNTAAMVAALRVSGDGGERCIFGAPCK
jgi:hypothetical protein